MAGIRFVPDSERVIAKPFLPGEEVFPDGHSRIEVVVRRILAMPEADVESTLHAVCCDYEGRHRDFDKVLRANFETVAKRTDIPPDISQSRSRLIGAYFSHEYSVEAAGLGNPSMVLAPDQSGLAPGEIRFIMSLRAIGEGHISSIEFRSGVVGADMSIRIDAPTRFAETGRRFRPKYDRGFFFTKLGDMGALSDVAHTVLDRLDLEFTMAELEESIGLLDDEGIDRSVSAPTSHLLHWIASSNYRLEFRSDSDLAERVIFPGGPAESRGMEDARFVRFVDDDGGIRYYGTYTAFDGFQILPQLLETGDFADFRVSTLSGEAAQNKGIALFPRKLDGEYVALGRQDNVNNFVMRSPDLRVWRKTEKIQEPERAWELTQLGNCGSPLETDAGWLVITHGVGPLRTYSLGALLLDIDNPSKVIGHLAEPLLSPRADEREGYVPNVVYSCGSMIAGDHLVVPYGFADEGAAIATVKLDDLLSAFS